LSARTPVPSETARQKQGAQLDGTPRDIFGGQSPQDLVATCDAREQRRVLEVLLRIDTAYFPEISVI
jgi:hypothetical protein